MQRALAYGSFPLISCSVSFGGVSRSCEAGRYGSVLLSFSWLCCRGLLETPSILATPSLAHNNTRLDTLATKIGKRVRTPSTGAKRCRSCLTSSEKLDSRESVKRPGTSSNDISGGLSWTWTCRAVHGRTSKRKIFSTIMRASLPYWGCCCS